ncbi:helix-turn-helix domain-containing protein [Clostridium chromiireducens]|jgi:hypothetical protein|uniref:Helix-turn-helix domain-containing protein n=1 Tax=Clostridium chromiireducens TaxID=225345 RepID=A0A964W257_9CLOT|nr:helix-turn-helix domain-containing protein [Clostridium chromiireducens]MVX63727.1 helix-turn-helix domain-containing protein [Clostridium chromiireducens]
MNPFVRGIKPGDNCYVFSGNYENTRYEIISNDNGRIVLDTSSMAKDDIKADREYELSKYQLHIDYGFDDVLYGITCYLDNIKVLAIEVLINSEAYLKNTMTFSEAAEKWGITDSALRKMINTGKLKEYIHYRKSGSTWLITKNAMKKIYGKEKE